MIFLTVGSELPFDRLVKAVDQWCGNNKQQKIFGQIGQADPDGYRPLHFDWKEFMPPDVYHQKYDEAELIIGHAGMGSIITALVKAKPILIMPRRSIYRETRNNHQVATASKFSERKGVFVAKDETAVSDMLDKWNNIRDTIEMESARPYADERLIKTIRDFILAGDNVK